MPRAVPRHPGFCGSVSEAVAPTVTEAVAVGDSVGAAVSVQVVVTEAIRSRRGSTLLVIGTEVDSAVLGTEAGSVAVAVSVSVFVAVAETVAVGVALGFTTEVAVILSRRWSRATLDSRWRLRRRRSRGSPQPISVAVAEGDSVGVASIRFSLRRGCGSCCSWRRTRLRNRSLRNPCPALVPRHPGFRRRFRGRLRRSWDGSSCLHFRRDLRRGSRLSFRRDLRHLLRCRRRRCRSRRCTRLHNRSCRNPCPALVPRHPGFCWRFRGCHRHSHRSCRSRRSGSRLCRCSSIRLRCRRRRRRSRRSGNRLRPCGVTVRRFRRTWQWPCHQSLSSVTERRLGCQQDLQSAVCRCLRRQFRRRRRLQLASHSASQPESP